MLINLSYQNSMYNQSSKNHTTFGAMPPHRKLSAFEKQLTEKLRASMQKKDLDSLSKALDRVTKAADAGMNPDRLKEFYIEFRMITRFLKNNLNLAKEGHEACRLDGQSGRDRSRYVDSVSAPPALRMGMYMRTSSGF